MLLVPTLTGYSSYFLYSPSFLFLTRYLLPQARRVLVSSSSTFFSSLFLSRQ